uniref:Uncharacterized protein n=1 Tax=Utricularia reniformis TaxID=192314 RepID=A0A1Y0B0G3_9LAMI|nr:hypothetical protein AEK19_MT0625 [Utricularia reniformis]ART30880.1 hypothetical protein AEK19_MT0625 [Utricularia reniformis]
MQEQLLIGRKLTKPLLFKRMDVIHQMIPQLSFRRQFKTKTQKGN